MNHVLLVMYPIFGNKFIAFMRVLLGVAFFTNGSVLLGRIKYFDVEGNPGVRPFK